MTDPPPTGETPDPRGTGPDRGQQSDPRHRGIGYLEIIGAAVLWGSSGPMSVALMDMGVAPESLAILRPLIGAVVLVGWALLGRRGVFRRSGSELLILLGVGGIGVGLFQLAFQFSTEAVGVPTTVGLLYLAPAMVVATAGPVLREWPTGRTIGLAILSVAGVWMMIRGAGGAGGPGNLVWGVICGASFAFYTMFGRIMAPRYGSFAVVLFSTLGGVVVLSAAWAVDLIQVSAPPARGWPLLIVFGVTTMAVAAVLFFNGLKKVEASRAAIVATAEPVTASILATLLLGQGMSATGWLGLGLVVIGVAGASRARGTTEPH